MNAPGGVPTDTTIVLPDAGVTCRNVTVPMPDGVVGVSPPQADTSATVHTHTTGFRIIYRCR